MQCLYFLLRFSAVKLLMFSYFMTFYRLNDDSLSHLRNTTGKSVTKIIVCSQKKKSEILRWISVSSLYAHHSIRVTDMSYK